MSRENVEVVLDQFAATNERDFAQAMSYYADDVELIVHADTFLEEGEFQGREAVGRWFGNWFATFEPGYHFDIEETQDLGDVVYLLANHHGRGRTSGLEVRGTTACLYTVRDGKIVRAEIYPSPAAALEAAPRPIVVPPGQGHHYGNVEFLARSVDTPRFTFGIIEIAAGRELEPHVHGGEDDAFYILEGSLTFTFGDEEAAAPPGTFVLVPPGISHGFRNDGDMPVRMLNIHAPAGFDRRIGLYD